MRPFGAAGRPSDFKFNPLPEFEFELQTDAWLFIRTEEDGEVLVVDVDEGAAPELTRGDATLIGCCCCFKLESAF